MKRKESNRAQKDRLKKDERRYRDRDALMDRATIGRTCSRTWEQEEAIAGTALNNR